ncbi:MAG: type IX secretion system membrane protein PorP/SprF [Bacteroidales bacterium]|jgi:type IX secretion system PorP/SprF family membrane protein|nr:type IX secretion system membrane protein PorP/SprF [Bacteroidales bacterium]
MTGKKLIICIIAICFLPIIKSFGQDVAYSQFYANPLYLNPALTGATLSPRISANYRNQWPLLNKAFSTYSVSYDHYVDAISSGFGLIASVDQVSGGLLASTSAQLIYSYRVRASRRISINLALSGGMYQKSLDWNDLDFGAMSMPEIVPDQTSKIVPDFGFGAIMGYKDVFYFGFALQHMTQPITSFYEAGLDKLYRKFTVHMGGNIFFGGQRRMYSDAPPTFALSPAIVYIQQFKYHQINIGLNLTIYPFVIGAWYRNNIFGADAVIALLGFQYRGFQLGYSYDITVSRLTNASGGAHEISLGYRFRPSKVSRKTLEREKAIPCPRF